MKRLIKLVSVIVVMTICITAFSACGNSAVNNADESDKLVVAVSIVPEGSFVKAVCGDLVEVQVMVPPGNSPENYEPTPIEIQNLAKADIYFSIGVPVESQSIIPSVSSQTKLVKLEDVVSEAYPDVMIGESRDPHIWLSAKRAVVMVQTIADEMCLLDPDNAEIYKANASNYISQINSVDNEIKDILSTVKNRKFVVYHPAFGYIAADYDLEMFALEEEGKEATAQSLAKMIDLAKEQNIKVIFYQEEVSANQAKAYADEIGGKTVMLSPLAEDYVGNLRLMAQTMAEAME